MLVRPGGAEEPPEGYYEDAVDELEAEAAAARSSDATSESDSDSQSGSVAGGSSADVQPRRQLSLTDSARPDTNQQVDKSSWMLTHFSEGQTSINKGKHSCGSARLWVELLSHFPPQSACVLLIHKPAG